VSGRMRVVDPGAAPVTVDDAGFAQDFEVVGDGRPGQVERVGQVADAGFAVGVGGDQGQQSQPDRVGDGLEHPRQLHRLSLGQRGAQHW